MDGWGKDAGGYGRRHRPLLGSSLGQLVRVPSPRPLPYPSLPHLWRARERRSLAPAARAERAGVVLVCGGCFWSGWGSQGGQKGETWGMAYLRGVKWGKGKEKKRCECEYTSQQSSLRYTSGNGGLGRGWHNVMITRSCVVFYTMYVIIIVHSRKITAGGMCMHARIPNAYPIMQYILLYNQHNMALITPLLYPLHHLFPQRSCAATPCSALPSP